MTRVGLLLALPSLSAGLAAAVAGQSSRRAARGVAVVGALLSLVSAVVAALAAAGRAEPLLATVGPLRLALDGISAPILPAVALMAVAFVTAAPRRVATPWALAAILAAEAAYLALYVAGNLLVLGGAWALALLPGLGCARRADAAVAGQRLSRLFTSHLCLALVPLAAAFGVIAVARMKAGAPSPLDLAAASPHELTPAVQATALALVSVATLARLAIVPLHTWLPSLVSGDVALAACVVLGATSGLYTLVRLSVTLLPDAAAAALPAAARIGLASAAFGALVALAQRDARRGLGYVAVSHSGLLLLGAATLNLQSLGGALTQMLTLQLGLAGLLSLLWAVEARVGTTDLRSLGGLITGAPRLSALFVLLGVAFAGAPCALGFVGEDLILEGLVHEHAALALGFALVSALNGVAVARLIWGVCFGPPTVDCARAPDLRAGERVAALVCLAALVLGGMTPRALVAMREGALRALARSRVEAPAIRGLTE